MITIYYQIKILISFWCRQGLKPKSFIQPLEILPIELIGTHDLKYLRICIHFFFFLRWYVFIFKLLYDSYLLYQELVLWFKKKKKHFSILYDKNERFCWPCYKRKREEWWLSKWYLILWVQIQILIVRIKKKTKFIILLA